MNLRVEILLWAQRIVAKSDAPAHQLLELPATSTPEQAQEAFQKIARTSHPDLHRTTLDPTELELVTTAYARVAAAYQELRTKRGHTIRAQASNEGHSTPRSRSPSHAPAAPTSAPMNHKAQLYYRKAELSLHAGEVKTALLHLKMAIVADPHSPFLRTALADLEAGLAKQP